MSLIDRKILDVMTYPGKSKFRTKALKSNLEMMKLLYVQKEEHLSKLSNSKQINSLNKNLKKEVVRIEAELQNMGFPSTLKELSDNYGSVDRALKLLQNAQDISNWIRNNYPQKYRQKLEILDSEDHTLDPKLTGKWKGNWNSRAGFLSRFFVKGKITMGICQIDNILLGRGALTNSFFANCYLDGTFLDNEVKLEVFDGDRLIADIRGYLAEGRNTLVIKGTYNIGYDYGVFEVVKDMSSYFVEQSAPQNIDLNSRLMEIIKLQASRPINVETKTVVEESKNVEVEMNFHAPVTGATGTNKGIINISISEQKQILAEAASEIQQLLKQFEETHPSATEPEQVAYVTLEARPDLKQRVTAALKAGGDTAIDEFFLENKYLKVGKAVIQAWLQPNE